MPLDDAVAIPLSGPSTDEIADANDGVEAIVAAIALLPGQERTVAVLAYLQGQSQRDIATFLDLPVSTVNNRMRGARLHLRQYGVPTMPAITPQDHSDLVDRIGSVVRSGGATIDARVPERPPILRQVTIAGASPDAAITAQVAQYLDDDLVRCFPVGDAPANALTAPAGAAVQDAGARTSLPMDLATLRRALSHMRGMQRPHDIVETGIKTIDLCCPIGPGAVVGLIGDMHVGKMVLAGELVHRLPAVDPPLSIVVLVEATTEALAIESLEYRTSPSVETIYLPVADASPEALAPVLDQFDTVIVLNRELGRRRLYPAIDPLRSTSRLLDPAITGAEHLGVLGDLHDVLTNDPDSIRAERLRYYLSQPFFTAEPWTNRPGVTVPPATTIADVRTLLAGEVDGIAPESLSMSGALPGG